MDCLLQWSADTVAAAVNQARVMRDSSLLQVPIVSGISWRSLRLRFTSTRFIRWSTSRGNQLMQFDSNETRSKFISLKKPFGNSFNEFDQIQERLTLARKLSSYFNFAQNDWAWWSYTLEPNHRVKNQNLWYFRFWFDTFDASRGQICLKI